MSETIIDQILSRCQADLKAAMKRRPLRELKAEVKDAPEVRSFKAALDRGFGLIAEIKRKSPSIGTMPKKNFGEALGAYIKSPVVNAISVLTNGPDFGMSLDNLKRVRGATRKPVLRKDFIFDEYQVYEARVYGADAILLMASILKREELRRLFHVASELGMDVLFESHSEEEIESIPDGAKIYGINSRQFKSRANRTAGLTRYSVAKLWARFFGKDLTTDLSSFELVKHLPRHATKVAESGVTLSRINEVREHGFDSILVGTALLKSPDIHAALAQFEAAIQPSRQAVLQPAPV